MDVRHGLRRRTQDRSAYHQDLVVRSSDAFVQLLHEEAKILIEPQVHIFMLCTRDTVGGSSRTEGVQLQHQQVRCSVLSQMFGLLDRQRQFDNQRVGFRGMREHVLHFVREAFLAFLRRGAVIGGDVHARRPLSCCQRGDLTALVLVVRGGRQSFAISGSCDPLLLCRIEPTAGVRRVSRQQDGGLGLNTDGVDLRLGIEQTHTVGDGLREQRLGGQLQFGTDAACGLIFEHRVDLTVPAGKIGVHGVAMAVGRGTRDERCRRLIAAVHEVREGDCCLERLFAQRPQTSLLPVRTKHSQILGRQTVRYRHYRQTRSGTQHTCQQAQYQRSI